MGDIVTPLRNALRRARQERPIPLNTRIALERVLADLTASQCARAMGWSHTVWQKLEDGRRVAQPSELPKIAAILGCTVERLQGAQAQATPGWRRNGRPPREIAA